MIIIVKRLGDFVAGKVKMKMVEGAVQLLARRGLQSTSFAEVLELTGAPRGSLYHHFPEGKDQLVQEAVALAGERAIDLLKTKAGASAVAVTQFFVFIWRELLLRSNFQAGCAVLAVAVASDSKRQLDQTAAVFWAWRMQLTELLEKGGLEPLKAASLAATLISACEGAVVLSRAEQSLEPFDLVSSQLVELVRTQVTRSSTESNSFSEGSP